MCDLEVQPQAKVTEAWVGNIQSKARPQESHSLSQRIYHCEMVSTGVQGWDLGSTHSIKLHPGRAVRLSRGKEHTVSAELKDQGPERLRSLSGLTAHTLARIRPRSGFRLIPLSRCPLFLPT